MKFQLIIKITLMALLCNVFALRAQSDNEEQKLRQTIELFGQAFVNADVKTLDALLTEKYRHTNSGSKAFGKTQWLKWIAGRQQATTSGELKYTSYQTEDLQIVLYGGSAVVTGRNIAKGIDKNKAFMVDIRFTHLWVKENEQWKRAAFQDAKTKLN
ncbi:nuclear transport factor 2 family protein [Aliikangiella sp. IMCC44359]|uniref:nuclear transport factor 2 family protein n=1 Tax=Aliikangiella sp. IMCC44359 TaxID=3459125 RepID=UPI00403B147B